MNMIHATAVYYNNMYYVIHHDKYLLRSSLQFHGEAKANGSVMRVFVMVSHHLSLSVSFYISYIIYYRGKKRGK